MRKASNAIYRTVSGVNLLADVFMPDADGSYPTVLMIQGGGWTSCNKDDWGFQAMCSRFPAAGYVCVAMTYRLVPQFTHPAPLEDLRWLLGWLRANATTYSINPARLAACGFSAGGHLGLLLANDPSQDLRAFASWSGPAHFPAMSAVWPHWQTIQNYVGVPYSTNPPAWRNASAYYGVNALTCPTFITHAQGDMWVPYQQSVDMRDRLLERNVAVDQVFATGSGHAGQLDAVAWGPMMSFFGRYV